ncbi:MAG: hypothetical protein CVV24_13570 [Ignavibacteriae bacterium HGW-Ignavibacteriae-3]|nr:MAG: hypothetical protein CVV24_13570 [Ignavibacteriae bacterium HGW-Ignavibacteriae-3]
MKLTLKDKSNYIKGLLILIGKDKIIRKEERELLMDISAILGFDQNFIKEAIDEILINKYIIEEPPVFSKKEIAKAFIKDGIKLACSDKELHLYELNWLKSVVEKNKLESGFGLAEFEKFQKSVPNKIPARTDFEISKLVQ